MPFKITAIFMPFWLQSAHGAKVISLADLTSGMLNNTEEAQAQQAAEQRQAAAKAESFVTADEARDTVAPLDTPPQTGQHPLQEGHGRVCWMVNGAQWHLQHSAGQRFTQGCE